MMDVALTLGQLGVIAAIAFATSVVGGMVGIGGAVLLIPAFLVIPPLVGIPALDMYRVSGITSVQVLASSLFGAFLHSKRGAFDRRLVLAVGIPLMLASFLGAMLSGSVSAQFLEALFGAVAIIGALMLLVRPRDTESLEYTLSYPKAIGIALPVGLFGGMVGMAGGFLLAPLLVTIVGVPLRVTIGSTLGIVIIGALATSVGKFMAGMVDPISTAAAIIGALPGMWIGVRISHHLQITILRRILAAIIAAIGLGMLVRVIG
ncbi:MAG: sulfite exporter TauE/SafE family protein [Chlorobiota bacterium]|nr:MAG: sulfite exporter TauE/SafE family protein [Chlorobiota bacterium]